LSPNLLFGVITSFVPMARDKYPVFSTRDSKPVPKKYRTLIPDDIKDYVSLNHFVA